MDVCGGTFNCPPVVSQVADKVLSCGVLDHGFARNATRWGVHGKRRADVRPYTPSALAGQRSHRTFTRYSTDSD
jgi:hypothetical protein